MTDQREPNPVSDCLGKEGFTSPRHAAAVAQRMRRAGKPVLSYRCQNCGEWHIGSHGPRRRSRKGKKP